MSHQISVREDEACRSYLIYCLPWFAPFPTWKQMCLTEIYLVITSRYPKEMWIFIYISYQNTENYGAQNTKEEALSARIFVQ